MTRREKYDRLLDLLAEAERLESEIESKQQEVANLVAVSATGAAMLASRLADRLKADLRTVRSELRCAL